MMDSFLFPEVLRPFQKLRKIFADSSRESRLRMVVLGIAGYTKNPGDAATRVIGEMAEH